MGVLFAYIQHSQVCVRVFVAVVAASVFVNTELPWIASLGFHCSSQSFNVVFCAKLPVIIAV